MARKKMNLKKITLLVGGVLVGFLLIVGVLGAFLAPSQGVDTSEGEYYDPRLEELRERSAELDEVYEGNSTFLEDPAASDDAFINTGQLSDFDSFIDEPIENEAPVTGIAPEHEPEQEHEPSTLAEGASNTSVMPSPFDRISTAETDDTDTDLLMALDSGGDFVSRDDMTDPQTAYAPSTARSAMDRHEVEEIVRHAVADAIGQHHELISLKASVSAQQQQAIELEERLDAQPELFRELAEELTVNNSKESFDLMVATLNERMDALEARTQAQQQQARRPSTAQLQNLYRLERIVGNTVVLVGQNTGRQYTFSEGDSLAYGGTLAAIRGDSVTLRWPTTQTTLSIY